MLKISDNGRFVTQAEGRPFFWLADTAWKMLQRAAREDIDHYLVMRAAQRFNVVQTVVISEHDGPTRPNVYGELPLIDENPLQPNDKFFDHVDYLVDAAFQHGMYIALLPTWGEWVTPRLQEKRIFAEPEQARAYGEYLGKRFGRHNNVIWLLGGDRLPDEAPNGVQVWRAMASGIRQYSEALMSYHCMAPSTRWFANDEWLSFHSFGSYHEHRYVELAFTQVEAVWQQSDPKPVINLEPCYERMTIDYTEDGAKGHFDALDVRVAAYWSVFAGAFGHSYGHNSIWQWHTSSEQGAFTADASWQDALKAPGGQQMQHLRNLICEFPFFERVPGQSLVVNEPGDGVDYIRATRDLAGTYALIYVCSPGKTLDVKLGDFTHQHVTASWFDPRTGQRSPIGNFATQTNHAFMTPEHGPDWVLILKGTD